MNRAVFLDRDGVLNPNVFNSETGEWESPHRVEDFELFPWVPDSLKRLGEYYKLFLVSNQPSYAKGKTSLENIQGIQRKLVEVLQENGLLLTEYYYCHHHPEGVVPEYSGPCQCRKPSPYFLLQARERYDLDMKSSWIVGDRMTDIQCGKSAGVGTIFIREGEPESETVTGQPDYIASDLQAAVAIILNNTNSGTSLRERLCR